MVDAAIALKDEITPHLIGVLEKLLANPNDYIANPDHYGHIYAVILLGYFGEPRAHEVIVDVFSLPGRVSNDLFGDIITEYLPTPFDTALPFLKESWMLPAVRCH